MSDSVQVLSKNGIVRITIDRTARMNAIDYATMTELGELIIETAAAPESRVIVLTGAGQAFCTGADLVSVTAGQGPDTEAIMDSANRLTRAVVSAPIPVIARINGPAAGVGASLALAADLTYAVESTYLLLPFTNIGLMPDGGATALVTAAMGRTRAAELALLGQRLPAMEAARHGLITKAVPAEQLDAQVDAVAERLAAGPRRALQLTKAAVNAAALAELDAAFEREKAGQQELLLSADFAEGAAAMLTKRAPKFG